MPIEGPLKELSIHDVFQLLDLSRKTGTLKVVSDLRQNAGTVFFEDGAVVGADIRSNPHPLGRLLIHAGRLSEAGLTAARAKQEGGDARRLGEILLADGVVTQRELARVVRQQIEEVVFEMVGWSEGYFAFEDGKRGDWPTEAETRIPTGALLMEAARRTDEWSRIEKIIPHLGVVPKLAPVVDTGTPLDLLPPEWELLAVVDGTRTVRDLANVLGRPEFEVARTLFGLATAGIILLEDPARRAMEAIGSADLPILLGEVDQLLGAGDPEAAAQAAEQAVSGHPDEPLAHLAHGRALLAAARPLEASEALWQAVQLDAHSAPAQRLFGLSLAATGRFREAAQVWDQWRRLADKPPEEDAQAAAVDRVRQAALALDLALRGPVTEDIRTLSAQYAADPASLVFLRLGEALRQRGQTDAALKVALQGLGRYPHLPDAHDLYARILTDRHDYATAFDEWDTALRHAPHHIGAHKGIGFLYYRAGEREQALYHLRIAASLDPDDAGLRQAVERVGGGAEIWDLPMPEAPPPRGAAEPDGAPAAAGAPNPADPFAGMEGGHDRLLLVDADGLRLGGGLAAPDGRNVSDEAAALLAATTREAARAARLLELGGWAHLTLEGEALGACLLTPSPGTSLLAAMDTALPAGQLTYFAERAAKAARAWLERVQ